jgi:hypothetical protein
VQFKAPDDGRCVARILYNYGVMNFDTLLHCWIFLYELYCGAQIYEHQVQQQLIYTTKHNGVTASKLEINCFSTNLSPTKNNISKSYKNSLSVGHTH